MKICIIKYCFECNYCSFDSDYTIENEGYCLHEKIDDNKSLINNVCEDIPKWCPLENYNKKE